MSISARRNGNGTHPEKTPDQLIAVIGLHGRFPAANDPDQLWRNLANGVESITSLSEEEMRAVGVPEKIFRLPGYVSAASILDDVDKFDAAFFGFSARDAELTDPQHRLFMECAWQALENAGYDPDTYPGAIALYGGCEMSGYLYQIHLNVEVLGAIDGMQLMVTNDKDHLTTHTAYKLNLRGPTATVQTTCSTSLVAVSLACQNLLEGRADMALAGGVTVKVPQRRGYYYMPGGILSPDGHCRPFDASAQGTIVGSGVGLVVLKRLSDALADGDQIRAVIRGFGVNNDGSAKVGYTAPSVQGQVRAIKMALDMAQINPETIGYVEAHGTATMLGDPIEFSALAEAYRAYTDKKGYCALGSVKGNFGHLSCAAGVTGLIKTILVLERGWIPPSINCPLPNPTIDFASSPFYVNREMTEWKRNGSPRRAGVSSFGVGGTNAHLIVEEAPYRDDTARTSRSHQVFTFAARSPNALQSMTQQLAQHVTDHPDLDLADAAYTQHVGRKAFPVRQAVVCRTDDPEQLVHLLAESRTETPPPSGTEAPVVFMFSGQGSQYPNMGRGLYEGEPEFRHHVDRCLRILKASSGLELKKILFPAEAREKNAAAALRNTEITQPALFVIEYALAQLYLSWGITPKAMIGHSIGEYVAATLAGVLSLDDALALVVRRGQLMSSMPPGAMLAVLVPERQARKWISPEVSLAAVNAPGVSVLAGPSPAIEGLEARLDEASIPYRRLHTSHAFHSAMMDPILDEFVDVLRSIPLATPHIPYISNLTGSWVAESTVRSPGYWGMHLRSTVRFADGIAEIMQRHPGAVLLEVGPGRALVTSARQCIESGGEASVLYSLPAPGEAPSDVESVLMAVGGAWMRGASVDWQAFHAYERRRRVSLPTYPFERQSYWIGYPDRLDEETLALARSVRDMSGWFSVKRWLEADPVVFDPASWLAQAGRQWLIFADALGLAPALAQRLQQRGDRIVVIQPGERFEPLAPDQFVLRPGERDDYDRLIRRLAGDGFTVGGIVHLWNVGERPDEMTIDTFWKTQDSAFFSPLYLAQAVTKAVPDQVVPFVIVSNHVHRVSGEEAPDPGRATLLGVCSVLPQEYPNLRCLNVDVELPSSGSPSSPPEAIIEPLFAEIVSEHRERVVALRGGGRWLQEYERVQVPKPDVYGRLREGGVYLITGGLGNIGLTLAEALVKAVRARVILVSRSNFPNRRDWHRWLQHHNDTLLRNDKTRKVHKLAHLEELGGEVLVLRGDVTDEAQMRAVVDTALGQFGTINGVIHGAGNLEEDAFASAYNTDFRTAAAQFQPKVAGLCVLQDVLRDTPLDFWCLQSSISTVLGGLDLLAYASANHVLDAVAAQQNRLNGVPWFCPDWDAWNFENFTGTPADAIQPQEGAEAFLRLVEHEPGSVVVSVTDLNERLAKWIHLDALHSRAPASEPMAAKGKFHQRPNLSAAYVAPRTATEKAIADVWREYLGVEPVGIQDRFFELGGHSLLAIQVANRLRDVFHIDVPVHKLFEAPTIVQLAEAIDQDLAHNRAAAEPPAQPTDAATPAVKGEQDATEGDLDIDQLLLDASHTPSADATKANFKRFYDNVSKQLGASMFGPHSYFLNYGYVPDGSREYSPIATPEYAINRNSVKLALEVIGDCDLTGRRVLDVGCGRGGTLQVVTEYFDVKSAAGLDLSSEAIHFCRENHKDPRVKFYEGDAENLPFKEARFDVVLNIESSHTYPNLPAFYRQVWRVLAPGGYFLYADLMATERKVECT
ncbi:MAG TPA: SDR family NAD(P)-dependent oxidoreductase, partial [Aggregatilineales bacterium]|nr:SDR family NAD(P)-dependent oxidoreductase [Aggregatilineales bacterium]